MQQKIDELVSRFKQDIEKAADSQAVENIRIAYLGKKGFVTEILQGMKALSHEERKEVGRSVNVLKADIEKQIAQRAEKIKEEQLLKRINESERFDVTLPTDFTQGSYHPITIIQREVEEIFLSMGFTIEDYDEIVDDYHCFESLNIPKHHPARDMQDTYYIENGQLLKTHTSAAQN